VHLSRHAFLSRKSFSYRAEQGLEIQREGIIHVSAAENGGLLPRIRVGGNAATVMEGTFRI
jgi:predicted PhzF superfamily epimerase YddE/YHI9